MCIPQGILGELRPPSTNLRYPAFSAGLFNISPFLGTDWTSKLPIQEQIEHLNYRSSYVIQLASLLLSAISHHITSHYIIHILIMHKLIEIVGKSVNHPLNPGLKFQTNKFNKTKGNWFLSISITSCIKHGSLNVPIEHHPTMNGIWSTRWLLFQVMSNIPKMGQLPFLMGKSTISMAIFNSYFDITRGYIL